MTRNKKILISIGTRPEIIKMAPIYHEMKRRHMQPVLLHTGQHNELAEAHYALFGMEPDHTLLLRRSGDIRAQNNLNTLSSLLLARIGSFMEEVNPAAIMVHGDTSSAFISALTAFYQQRPIAHVEAGLRSHQEYNPFPEEKNREMIARIARWHFAPTPRAEKNLLAEGVPKERIHMVGNTIIEAAALGASLRDVEKVAPDIPYTLTHGPKKRIVLITIHRRENREQLHAILHAAAQLLEHEEDLHIVWPVHPNPMVKNPVYNLRKRLSVQTNQRLHISDPLSYPVMLWMLQEAWLVMTDSGGLQEEAVALNTPVLVLRDSTERPEVVESGGGLVIGAKTEDIIAQVRRLKNDHAAYNAMRTAVNPFGDGNTAKHICEILQRDMENPA